MHPGDRLWHLKNMASLQNLSMSDLDALAAHMTECHLEPGDRIAPRDLEGSLYFLKTGRLRLERLREGGEPLLVDVLGPGDVLGSATGEGEDGGYEATAVDHALACSLPEGKFRELAARRPVIQVRLLRWTGRRLARIESRLEDLVFRSLSERLPDLLASLARRIGWSADDGEVVPLSQQDVARLAGASREATSRALGVLRKQGLVETRRGRLIWKGPLPAAERT